MSKRISLFTWEEMCILLLECSVYNCYIYLVYCINSSIFIPKSAWLFMWRYEVSNYYCRSVSPFSCFLYFDHVFLGTQMSIVVISFFIETFINIICNILCLKIFFLNWKSCYDCNHPAIFGICMEYLFPFFQSVFEFKLKLFRQI
jgi:hypothetical protein